MQFLVAIRSTVYSARTLELATSLAKGFKADLSVLYVGDRPRELVSEGVNLSRDAMLNWQINHPGVDVLRWAYEAMQKSGFIDPEIKEFDPTALVEDSGRIRVVVPQVDGENVRLILREGETVDQLKKETDYRDYILTVVGGGSRKRLARRLVQFVDTSLLFVKNYDPNLKYKLLLCVDDSGATRKAVSFAARVAFFLKTEIKVVTVSKTKKFGPAYTAAADWAQRYLDKAGIDYTHDYITGDPVKTFVERAGSDHIIVIGKSRSSPIANFLRSSKPAETVLQAHAPVILVK
ncbi:MAG: universal stress protein [Candidatus Marinimicrobia bacterium]|nr:universal stress protein [Candidatus Neomarinimicrobiota bacterium]